MWRAAVSDDPLSRRHMRPRVAVAKHVGRKGGEREQKERDCGEAKPGNTAFGQLVARGAGERQGEGHRLSLPNSR